MKTNELVTVVIPVYNVEKYVKECVDSVLAQTYSNLEVIAVNDGSKDGSLAVLEQYEDARLRIITQSNAGLSAARNTGLKNAHGSYICFIDSDDIISPYYVEKLYQSIQNTQSEIAVADMEYFYEDGTRKFSVGGQFSVTDCIDNPKLITINNSACNKLFETRLFDDIQFPVGAWYEDLATVPILLYKAKRVSKVDEALYDYRQRSGSIAHSADRRIFHIYTALNGLCDYVKAHGNEDAILKELYSLYIVHGLDLTTLRIKDFDDRSVREEYLKENMTNMRTCYPNYKKDVLYQNAGKKKKLIYSLLSVGMYGAVLKIYDR